MAHTFFALPSSRPSSAGPTSWWRRLTSTPGTALVAGVYVLTRAILVLIPFGFFPYPRGILVAADIRQYWVWADVIGSGHFPVNDPMWQYPPLAGFVFWIGQQVSVRPLVGFVGLALLLDAILFMVLLRRGMTIRDQLRSADDPQANSGLASAWFYVLAGAAIGPLLLTRFDIFPTFFAVLALLIVARPVRSGILLGVGALLKLWPGFLILALPRRSLSKGLSAMLIVGVVGLSIAMLYGPYSMSFLSGQGERGLQIESVGAIGYIFALMAGFDIEVVFRFGSTEVDAAGAGLIATVVTFLGFAVIAVIGWLRLRGRLETLASADIALALVLVLIVSSRVFSPQFMVWAAGISAVALLSRRTLMRPVAGLVLFVCVLGQIVYPLGYKSLLTGGLAMGLVQTARVSALVAATAWALWRIYQVAKHRAPDTRAGSSPADDPTEATPHTGTESHRQLTLAGSGVLHSAVGLVTNRLRITRLSQDRGAVLVTASIVMVPLMLGSAAIGVDASNWYYMGQRLQVAADSAALAGAVYMPGNFTVATSTARDMSDKNGFAHDPGNPDVNQRVTVTPAPSAKASELRVTVTATKSNWFGWAVGSLDQTMTRTAVAEYRGPILMGSPCNLFGDEPPGGTSAWETASAGAACNRTPEFWANVAGPGSKKSYGDRYATRRCSNSNSGCTSEDNDDYSPTGHFYKVSVKAPVSSISLEIFDPALVNVGDYCETDNLDGSWSPDQPNPYSTIPGDAAERYDGGAGSAYCTGDKMFSGSATTSVTTFAVREPIQSGNPLAAPVRTACTKQFRGYGSRNIKDKLDSSDNEYNDGLAAVFRQWSSLCTISNPVVGDYYIQVRTNLPSGTSSSTALNSATEYPTVAWSGHNRYSMRVNVVGDSSQVNLAGYGQMVIYTNSPAAETSFYLARVNPASAGMSLDVNLFDAGDAAAAGVIRIEPPPDAVSGGAALSLATCQAIGEVRGSANNPQSIADCAMTNVSKNSGFNGKSQVIRVPIPVDYDCNEADPNGCWFKIDFNYPAATNDTTSWATDLVGQPVRLVE
jgi:Flp pilus assembly protein TadG